MSMANPKKERNGFSLVDIYGDKRFISFSDIADSRYQYQRVLEHYIPEKLMLGKAMVVFWPIYPYFRWKLLR
jgi:hypothetical protein